MIDDHHDYGISSTVTVHAEIGNFKLSVDKNENAEIIFRGYKKSDENVEWVEILPEQTNNNINYIY